jgi:glycerate 2-kinase
VRVLVCPDKFAGTLSSVEAASAIAEGWLAGRPSDRVTIRPIADGGPGFLSVLHAGLGGQLRDVATTDPLGRPVTGSVLVHGDTAYLESAQACGLHLLAVSERDPLSATTFGLGALVTAALESPVRAIVVGLGGSATNDGGAGLLSALSAPPRSGADILGSVSLIGASDVDNPLTGPSGASAVFGPQKGASPSDVELLDARLAAFAASLERNLPGCPPGLSSIPGGGAAGGLGAAILALGGRLISGVDLVLERTGLSTVIGSADLVLTGEGSFDAQSLRGKATAGVLAAAQSSGVPCLVLAGQVTVASSVAHSVAEHVGSVERALTEPAESLRSLAARLAETYAG